MSLREKVKSEAAKVKAKAAKVKETFSGRSSRNASRPMTATATATGAQPAAIGTSSDLPTSSTPSGDPTPIVERARELWKEHRPTILASIQVILEIVEKGLDGLPIPGPKAAFGSVAAAVKAVRIMDENNATVDEIVEKIEGVLDGLAQLSPTTPAPGLPVVGISQEAATRIEKFEARLTEIKSSVACNATTNRNFLVRITDAERIAGKLKDVWTEVQAAYNELIAATVLSMEKKVDEGQNRLLLDRLHPVTSAFYDAFEAAPSCLKGTRTQLLDEIKTWMMDSSTKPVYWLTGVAGTGKTTVAQSVAVMANSQEPPCLAASFFFSRTSRTIERRQAMSLIPTIAYQLAQKHPSFRPHICRAIESEVDIRTSQMTKQVKILLLGALKDVVLISRSPLLIVLDALDECDKEGNQEGGDFIPVLLACLQSLPFPMKIFVTSRPEPTIASLFNQVNIRGSTVGLALHRDIEDGIVRSDISRYLRHELDKIAARHSLIHPPFPSGDEFQVLVDRAGTLFIYVRTVVGYLSAADGSPRDQLTELLRPKSNEVSEQFAVLDTLYIHIFRQAAEAFAHTPKLHQFRSILGCLALLEETMPATALAALVGAEENTCKRMLRRLSSVLLYDHEVEDPVRVMHPSLPDFLRDPSRCTDSNLVVDPTSHHLQLAERCLQIMNDSLCMDICDIGDVSIPNAEVAELKQRLGAVITPQLRYACRFWHVHLRHHMQLSSGMFCIPRVLDEFCAKHLLHWLELLSLLDQFSYAQLLPPLLACFEQSAQLRGTNAYRLLLDVDRLVSVYHPAIRLGALYVYHSAAVTMPDCLLWRQFDSVECAARVPVLITERASDWGARIRVLEGHADWVTSVAFSHDDRLIVSGSRDCTVRVWDAATDTVRHVWSGYTSRVNAVALSPTSYTIALCYQDGTVRLWDAIRGSEMRVMDGHTEPVWCVTFSPDGQRIATGSEDYTVRVWDTDKGTQTTIMVGHKKGVTSVAFAPNGQLVASGSDYETARVWDAVTGAEQHMLCSYTGHNVSVAFAPDSAHIASASHNGTVRVWNAATGAQRITLEDSEGCLGVTYSSDGRWIAAGRVDGSIAAWDAATGTKQHVMRGHGDWVRSVAFSSDNRLVVSGSEDHTVRVWDVSVGIPHPDRTAAITIVAFSPDGTMVLLCTGPTTHIRNSTTGAELYTLEDHGWVYDAAFSFDSAFVITGSGDHTVRVWDAATGKGHRVLRDHQAPVTSIATSSNSHLIASVCREHIYIWDAMSGSQLYEISSPDGELARYVALSADNRLIATSTMSEGTLVWDVAAGIRQEWITHIDLPSVRVAFSQDGQWAAGAGSGNVKVWEVETGALRHVLDGHSGYITSIEFLPRTSLIASRCVHSTIQVWDADTGAALGPPQPGMPAAAPFPTTQVLASPFFSVGYAGWVWRLSTSGEWRRVSWLPSAQRGHRQASWGQKLCVGGESGSITLLDFANVG